MPFPAMSCLPRREQFHVIYNSSTWKKFILQQISDLAVSKYWPFTAVINIPEREAIKWRNWLWKRRRPLWMCAALWRVMKLNSEITMPMWNASVSLMIALHLTLTVICLPFESSSSHTNPVRTSQETHYISTTKPNRLMLFRETVAVYCENHMEHTDTLCGQNADLKITVFSVVTPLFI
jgi:hypothetical protein